MKGKLVVFIIVFFTATLVAKVYVRSAAEHKMAANFERSGKREQALEHYNLALRWYLPFNPYARKSLEAMWKLGVDWENRGETALALEAFRDARGAIMSVRSLYTPYKSWLKRVEGKIADLEASAKPYAADTNTSEAEHGKEASALLRLDKAPSVGWSVVTEIGFAGWVLCALGLALAINLKQKDKRGRRAFMWGLFLTFFLALWLVGMVNA